MEEIQGKLAELTKDGSTSSFVIHVKGGADTRVQTSRPLPKEIVEGDTVIVLGNRYPDPPFIAESVIRVEPAVKKKIPWIWIIAASAVCLILIVVLVLVNHTGPVIGESKQQLTVRAMDGAQPAAKLEIHLLDANKMPIKSATTDSDGECRFKDLKNGAYTAVDNAGESVSIVMQGDKPVVATLRVHSPYTWIIRTVYCNKPAPNSPISLFSASNMLLQSVQSGSNGTYTFANLKEGTYTARSKFNRSVTAVVDGKTAPPPGTLAQQSPLVSCFFFPGRGKNSLEQGAIRP